MRLTLRTLLAYLDEIPLPPEEAEELKQKIDDSEFAKGLIQRIRSALRRLRLGAPKVDGKGLALDANTVAEYLDNTLAAERVPDFERVCLESDVHLAEVAACHQILALVVSEPAKVPTDLRERMYLLPERQGERTASSNGTSPTHEPEAFGSIALDRPAAAVPSEREEEPTSTPQRAGGQEVVRPSSLPDYLRVGRRKSWQPWLVSAAFVVLLMAVAMMALGKIDEHHLVLGPIVRWCHRLSLPHDAVVAFHSRQAEQTAVDQTDAAGQVRQPDSSNLAPNRPADVSSQSPPSTMEPGERVAPGTSSEEASELPPRKPPTEFRGDVLTNLGAAPAEAPAVEPKAAQPADAHESPARPEGAAMPDATEAAPAGAGSGSGSKPGASTPDSPMVMPADSPASPAAGSGGAAVEIGRLLSGERRHVLARFDSQSASWFRVREREVLRASDILFVLPSYRPQLAFSTGIQALFIGPCFLELVPATEGAPAGFAISSGAASLDTAGVSGSSITVRLAGHTGQLKFITADATLAMDVTRQFPLGHDPLVTGAAPTARLIATSGQLEWWEAGQPPLSFSAGQELQLVDGLPVTRSPASALPTGIEGTELKDIELRASRDLEPLLAIDKPLSVSLLEQVHHRQTEVAALAIQGLVLIGEYKPAIMALNNERYAQYWRPIIQALQAALANQTQAGVQLQEALQQQRPDDAAILYRLLYGFDNEQLQAGDDGRLVSLLEHPALDLRVLAFDNLQRITGRSYAYRPERDPATQRRSLQEWRTALMNGQIRWTR